MNGIENYPAAGEKFLEIFFLKVSQTHFPRISTPRRGQCPSLGGGGREVPCTYYCLNLFHITDYNFNSLTPPTLITSEINSFVFLFFISPAPAEILERPDPGPHQNRVISAKIPVGYCDA